MGALSSLFLLPTAAISTLPSLFDSLLSVFLFTWPCTSSSFSASVLLLHLYYPLNNSLCIKFFFFSPSFLIPWRYKPWSTSSWQLILCQCSVPSLCFLPSLCCQEILLPSLLGDAVQDYSAPTFDLLPKAMRCVCVSLVDYLPDHLYPSLSLSMLFATRTLTHPARFSICLALLLTCKHVAKLKMTSFCLLLP